MAPEEKLTLRHDDRPRLAAFERGLESGASQSSINRAGDIAWIFTLAFLAAAISEHFDFPIINGR
jgi:hypothetical protein